MATKAQRIIALYDQGKLSYQQIADETDCCVGYVSAAIQRRNGSRPCDLAWARKQWRQRKSAARTTEAA